MSWLISLGLFSSPLAAQLSPHGDDGDAACSRFFKLLEAPPFRGKITHLKVDDRSIMATIERGDLQQVSIRHTPGQDWDKARRIAERLKQDGVYEFPAVLADDYQAPLDGFVPQATTDAMRALSGFIGEWRMRFTTGPGKDMKEAITIRYFWNNDGTGLWREVHLPASMSSAPGAQNAGKPRVNAMLTTYDPETKRYREISSTPSTKEMKESAEWDAATQTLVLHTTEGAAPHTTHHSTRRLVSPDRIEFHTKATKPDGSLLYELEGYYERIKP
ncbi:hypothetical protein [Prosthecobacter sp.]|uniref:hypothetical protein n=1 Tax=Prosthecobacter sp. TaxID=1965333 RepID=UPI003783DEA0